MKTLIAAIALLVAAAAQAQQKDMTFFITSAGPGKGADLGGLKGADAHCQRLAKAAGAGSRQWRAYLSTDKVNARDRIGKGPWITGSQPDGRAIPGDKEMTCGNWTKSGEGSAMVGHHDRIGLRDDDASKSWNASHPSRGCSQDALRSSGGDGLTYCFAVK